MAVSKTFRMNDETADKLQAISDEMGLSWDGTFATLATLYAQNQAVKVLPDRKAEVETFQTLMNQLAEMFSTALVVNANTDERIRQEYAKKITKLEERAEQAEDREKEAQNKLAACEKELADLRKQLAEYEKQNEHEDKLTAIYELLQAQSLPKERAVQRIKKPKATTTTKK